MTEEIIVNGVNVAGCCCFENDKCLWSKKYYENPYTPDCKLVDECYYKQLKRLEQENKELLETLTKGCYQNLQHECRIWELKESKYRSALEEIKEIINGHASPSACEYWGSYKNACEPCALRILNQVEDKIQNKINEVLNESN